MSLSVRFIRKVFHTQLLALTAIGLLIVADLCHAAAKAGKPAPAFTAADLQRRPVKLTDLRGQTVLVMFWATWCGPCRKEMPEVQTVYKKYAGKGFAVIAVNVGEEREDVEDYVAKMGIELPVVLDQEGDIAQRFEVAGLPTNYFVDPRGMVGEVFIGGGLNAERLVDAIKKYGSKQ